MNYYACSKSTATESLIEEINSALAKYNRVLWIVSGGSNIEHTKQTLDSIDSSLRTRLTLTLSDERYGEPGHPESNLQKFHQVGIFAPEVNILSVLQKGVNLVDTSRLYNHELTRQFKLNDFIIQQLGIGADGHTAGILPQSAAVTSGELVTSYAGADFERITLTIEALRRADRTLVFAFGSDKSPALNILCENNLSLLDQPAQIFKQIKGVAIYNDSIGRKI